MPRPLLKMGYFKVFLELRGAGYSGSTYTLLYGPEQDVMIGTCYQAVPRQNYDVVFVRANRQRQQ